MQVLRQKKKKKKNQKKKKGLSYAQRAYNALSL